MIVSIEYDRTYSDRLQVKFMADEMKKNVENQEPVLEQADNINIEFSPEVIAFVEAIKNQISEQANNNLNSQIQEQSDSKKIIALLEQISDQINIKNIIGNQQNERLQELENSNNIICQNQHVLHEQLKNISDQLSDVTSLLIGLQ